MRGGDVLGEEQLFIPDEVPGLREIEQILQLEPGERLRYAHEERGGVQDAQFPVQAFFRETLGRYDPDAFSRTGLAPGPPFSECVAAAVRFVPSGCAA